MSSLSLSLPPYVLLSSNQSYQLAEDLGKAFSDRAIFQTFIEAEAALSSGPLKVNLMNCYLHISP